MRKYLVLPLCFLLFILTSCEPDVLVDESLTTNGDSIEADSMDVLDTNPDTETTGAVESQESAEPMVATVGAFIEQMYAMALPPIKEVGSIVPAPGDATPVEELPRVAEGVVGRTVQLSLTDSSNELCWMLQINTDGTGMTLTIVMANGDPLGTEAKLEPLCVVLDVSDEDGQAFLASPEAIRGVIRHVCFLCGTEYMYVTNHSASVVEWDGDANGSLIVYGGIRSGGDAWMVSDNGNAASQTLQNDYRKIHTRFGVVIP